MITAPVERTGTLRFLLDNEDALARVCVIVALILAFCVNLPLISTNTVFGGDDWAWLWVYRSQGPAAIFRYMWDAAHPGYGPFLNIILLLGGDHAGQLAHVFAIVFHLGCGWLIWRVFQEARFAPGAAAGIAILYLAAPFLADLHASLAHSFYDAVIFSYFLSIYLSLRPGPIAIVGALLAMIVGLTIETLVVLEPLRWWLLWRVHREKLPSAAKAALPFALLALAMTAFRAFWLKPEGIYQGYNGFLRPDFGNYKRLAGLSLDFFINLKQPADFAGSLMLHDNPVFAGIVLVGACTAASVLWRSREAAGDEIAGFFGIGAIILLAGLVPYVAINDVPTRVDVESRFAVAAQFGALMIATGCICLMRFAPLRAAAVAALVFVFMANQLQLGKWLLFDGQVASDFRQQVGAYLAQRDPQVLVVDITPPSDEFLYVNRACLSSYDTNVGLELAGSRHGSFVFDRACGRRIYHNPDGCFITGYDPPGPCPSERRSAAFRLKPDLVPFSHMRLADLMVRNLTGTPLDAGVLVTPQPPDGIPATSTRGQ